MSTCKKFSRCSAPQCPLDPPSLNSKYISGEPICHWLSEYSKKGTRADLESAIGDIPIEVIAEGYEKLFSRSGTIRARLVASSKTGSRLSAFSCGERECDDEGLQPQSPSEGNSNG